MRSLIPIPKELENTYTQFFTLPNSSRLLIVTKNAVLTEFKGKLQNVLIISPPFGITDTAYVEQLADSSIAFKVQNENTKSITNYVLKHISFAANCEVILNADKPVLLEPKLQNQTIKSRSTFIDTLGKAIRLILP